MTTAATTTPIDLAGRRYLDEAVAALTDLPVGDREELATDLAAAVAELGPAFTYDELVERLGAPRDFARELRRSAGAEEVAADEGPADATPAADAVPGADTIGDRPAAATSASLEAPAAPTADRLVETTLHGARRLGTAWEPLGWLLRAFAVELVLVFVLGLRWGGVTGVAAIGVVLAAVSVVRGVHVRRTRSADTMATVRGAGIVAGLVLVAWFVVVMFANDPGDLFGGTNTVYESSPAYAVPAGLSSDGAPVTNVYAFDAKGNRLTAVRLYDQDGAPLQVGQDVPNDLYRDATNPERS